MTLLDQLRTSRTDPRVIAALEAADAMAAVLDKTTSGLPSLTRNEGRAELLAYRKAMNT